MDKYIEVLETWLLSFGKYFLSTTNLKTLAVPRKVLGLTSVLSPVTGTTAETQVFSGTIPGGVISVNGKLVFEILMGGVGTAGASKIGRIYINSILIGTVNCGTNIAQSGQLTLRNQNSLTSQVGWNTSTGSAFIVGTNSSLALKKDFAFNTTAALTVTVSLQPTSTADTVSLDGFEVIAVG